jgi:IS1 family transposase
MNKLSTAERVSVVRALVEGNSINSTVRITGISKPTILKLLAQLGTACKAYHDSHVRNVRALRIQCDELWSFCHCKQRNVPRENRGQFGMGDVWTWTAIDADSKLMIGYLVGLRDVGYAVEFMRDVKDRLVNRVQLTSDAHKPYLVAVTEAFGEDIDYAQLVKMYGAIPAGPGRYSPPACIWTKGTPRIGDPDRGHISTSYVERNNLTVRMCMRRFTRLTNGFSKKIENHKHAVALFFLYYNFARIHQTVRMTPAMAAGISDHVWSVEEIVGLID